MNSIKNKLKIAFLTSADPKDKRSWSGLYYYMAKALKRYCGEVYFLGPVKIDSEVTKPLKMIADLFPDKRYNYHHNSLSSIKYAEIFKQKLDKQPFDIIFAPTASTEIAFLNTKIPIIYLSDTTFALIHNYYPEFSNLMDISIEEGNCIERLAIKKSKVVLYPTEWAANSAIKDYGADRNKIRVIPFGANLDIAPQKEKIQNKRKSGTCRLLFVGVDWKRKGGEIAFETLLHLEKLGLKAELIVCGCKPPKSFYHKNMKVIPFLNKNNEKELETFYDLYYNADFFILPSRAECMGEVFIEASAFGVPSITTDTGGIASVVKNNENGFTLPIDARGEQYAELIYKNYLNDQTYYRLRTSSRIAFEERLNWDTWALKVKKIMEEII